MQVQFENNSDKFKAALSDKIPAVLEAIGLHLEGEAKDELENDPRRIDTGNLRNSITHQVAGDEDAVYIGTNVEYGIYVHEGTVRMAPNRFLKNAVERNETQVRQYIENELKSE